MLKLDLFSRQKKSKYFKYVIMQDPACFYTLRNDLQKIWILVIRWLTRSPIFRNFLATEIINKFIKIWTFCNMKNASKPIFFTTSSNISTTHTPPSFIIKKTLLWIIMWFFIVKCIYFSFAKFHVQKRGERFHLHTMQFNAYHHQP